MPKNNQTIQYNRKILVLPVIHSEKSYMARIILDRDVDEDGISSYYITVGSPVDFGHIRKPFEGTLDEFAELWKLIDAVNDGKMKPKAMIRENLALIARVGGWRKSRVGMLFNISIDE